MAHNARENEGAGSSTQEKQIAVAHTRCYNFNANFASFRDVHLNRFHFEGLANIPSDRSSTFDYLETTIADNSRASN